MGNVDILRYLSKLPGVDVHARASIVKQPTVLYTYMYATDGLLCY